ncbi:phospholipase D family protein [Mucilaginibacter roseus]|uniref:Phospholipase D family protein n=1 Tax=Mucilaginibacter roseus TaxID=1528868 RepID=A0ABS8U3X6_9SPHI|nr:phospholipase D family protein [Mucilaginibacter roseus]MCD8740775.1 phospholipase D family protein [Mucilaginibacter roseus]
MLDFKQNRLTYSDLLASPSKDFELTHAIGTTYSLDLLALLAIPVAMFYNRSLDGDFSKTRFDVLEAIRKSKERVTVFCQRGKIHQPDSYSTLLAFIENCIVEVLPDDDRSSFHPKIWVLRFAGKRKVIYRMAVLSRNLTFDRSWDISYFAEGSPQPNQKTASGERLVAFLKHFYVKTGQQMDRKIARELGTVDFDFPADFNSSAIFPIIGGSMNADFPNPVYATGFDELLVVSPFVDDPSLNELVSRNEKVVLFSREEELDKLDKALLADIEPFYFNNAVRDGEHTIDSESTQAAYQDLHAKFYIGRRKNLTSWYLGSANATAPAKDRNTEFLIKLNAKSQRASYEAMIEQLLNEQSRVFLPYQRSLRTIEPEEERLDQLLRRLNYKLSAAVYKGRVIERPDQQNFNLSLSVDLSSMTFNTRVTLSVALIHRSEPAFNLNAGTLNEWFFENIAMTHLSHFLSVEIAVDGRSECRIVVKADIKNMPAERDDVIFNELFNNKQSFYKYLQFLLAPDEYDGLMDLIGESTVDDNVTGGRDGQAKEFSPPIYEYLLLAASRSPLKLKEINQVMIRLERMNSEIVSDFKPVWDVFKQFAND